MEPIVILLSGITLFVLARSFAEPHRQPQMVALLVGSFVMRVVLNAFIMREMSFFSHGIANGDCAGYENNAIQIAGFWNTEGIHYVTVDDHPELNLATTSLIANLLAVVVFICGGEQCTVTCTSVIAMIALSVCLVIYRFALYMGSSESAAFKAVILTAIGPSFIYHTSDTYKDGLNALFVVSSLFVCVQLSRKFSLAKIPILLPLLWGLWNIRPYMVFMTLLPIAVGLLGIEKMSVRTILVLFVGVLIVAVVFTSGATDNAVETAQWQYKAGTNANSLEYNKNQGRSGVDFGEGPTASVMRLVYTVLSPFPWMVGSIGMQIGKIDVLIWYYILYGAWHASKALWKSNRGLLLVMLAFIGPATLAYSLTMSNVGLIVRQRMPIMMATSVIATLYWTWQEREKARLGALALEAQRRELGARDLRPSSLHI